MFTVVVFHREVGEGGCTYCVFAGDLTRDMEEEGVFTSDDVGNAVTVVGDWTETAASTDILRVSSDIHLVHLRVGSLQEWRQVVL
mgnify:CR=1 FL=1